MFYDRAVCDVVPYGPESSLYSNSAVSPPAVADCGLLVQGDGARLEMDGFSARGRRPFTGPPPSLCRATSRCCWLPSRKLSTRSRSRPRPSSRATGGFRDFGIFSATWRWLVRHAGLLLFLGLFVFDLALSAAQPVSWQVSFLGIRLGEAELPGHRRRAVHGR